MYPLILLNQKTRPQSQPLDQPLNLKNHHLKEEVLLSPGSLPLRPPQKRRARQKDLPLKKVAPKCKDQDYNRTTPTQKILSLRYRRRMIRGRCQSSSRQQLRVLILLKTVSFRQLRVRQLRVLNRNLPNPQLGSKRNYLHLGLSQKVPRKALQKRVSPRKLKLNLQWKRSKRKRTQLRKKNIQWRTFMSLNKKGKTLSLLCHQDQ